MASPFIASIGDGMTLPGDRDRPMTFRSMTSGPLFQGALREFGRTAEFGDYEGDNND